jgi:uncharacterized phage-associated protein
MTHDVRSIANLVLDVSSREGVRVTNLAINKIVFFLYVDYLLKYGRPLSGAKIEAWEHGPVFRELYSAFKSFGDKPIEGRVTRIDPVSGVRVECQIELSELERAFLEPIIRRLIKLSASKLRALSHLEGGPWHRVWCHSGKISAGMQITDAVIVDSLSTLRRQ